MFLFKKIIFKLFPHWMKSKDYVKILKSKGVVVGEGTHFFGPASTEVDIQRPWLLEIGSYCKITSGVKILTHDYSRSVLRKVYGDVIGEAGKTIIGNNVFIGMNSIVLMGTQIGDNVIVGAGSVVSGKIPDNVVVAGNPAKVIRTLDEHYSIRKDKTLEEAKLYYNSFIDYFGYEPREKEMGPFWQLFTKRDEAELKEIFTDLSGDNESEIINYFLASEARFESFEEFKKYCTNK